jgi:hypothetical protein
MRDRCTSVKVWPGEHARLPSHHTSHSEACDVATLPPHLHHPTIIPIFQLSFQSWWWSLLKQQVAPNCTFDVLKCFKNIPLEMALSFTISDPALELKMTWLKDSPTLGMPRLGSDGHYPGLLSRLHCRLNRKWLTPHHSIVVHPSGTCLNTLR